MRCDYCRMGLQMNEGNVGCLEWYNLLSVIHDERRLVLVNIGEVSNDITDVFALSSIIGLKSLFQRLIFFQCFIHLFLRYRF